MPFGAEVRADGTVRFRIWAPAHAEVGLELDGVTGPLAMPPVGDGWHELITDQARPGTRYGFVLPDGLRVPDPASRHQPKDVHGPSEVVDPTSYVWADTAWRGRRWEEAVVYELHIGAFTPEGPFRRAIEQARSPRRARGDGSRNHADRRLPSHAELGLRRACRSTRRTPVAWPRPEALKGLIDSAHCAGA